MISSNPELIVTDMDGTLTDTKLVVVLLGRACLDEDISVEPLLKLVDSYSSLGISYNAWSYVEKYGPDVAEAVKGRFLEYSNDNSILYDDARDYLDFLEEVLITNIIMTKGDQTWQEIKLKAARLDQFPHQIIDDDSKGNVIKSWRTASGQLYIVPREILGASAPSVILSENNLSDFKGLPDDCSGYLVARDDKKNSALQAKNLPPNIKIVRNLLEIIEDIDLRLIH